MTPRLPATLVVLSVLVAAAPFAFGLLGACTPPPPTSTLACERDQDCALGYRCGEGGRCLRSDDAGGLPLDDGGPATRDGGPNDAGAKDDAGPTDAGDVDDAALPDSGVPDGGAPDASDGDGGTHDDAGPSDAGPGDAGNLDGGTPDGGPLPAALFAVHPELAAVGDGVLLEGRFPAGTYGVSFGGATASVTVGADSARLTLPVPNLARSGSLKVTLDGLLVGSLPFRVTSFTPSVGAFASELEQTLAARSLSRPGDALERAFVFSTGSFLHAMDSRVSGGGVVESARVWADGSLGRFRPATSFVGLPRATGRAFVRVADWLYGFGGDLAGDPASLDDVIRAPILPDGTLGAFVDTGGSLVTARAYASAVVGGGFVYVIGGRAESDQAASRLRTIERAPILANGDLGPFEDLGARLVEERDRSTAHVIGEHLYVIGGTGSYETIERAPVLRSGDLGTFSLVGTASFVPRRSHASVVLGSRLCVVGGRSDSGNTPLASVQCAVVAPNTPQLAFVDVGALQVARGDHGVAVAGNRLFVLGGDDGSDSLPLPIEWAPIDFGAATTDLGQQEQTALPNLRHMACAVVEDRLLVTGGEVVGSEDQALSNDVWAAPLDADGALGAFVDVGNLHGARAGHRLLVHDDELWVLGGNDGTQPLKGIQRAPIDSLTFYAEWRILPNAAERFYAWATGSTLHVAGGALADDDTSGLVGCLALAGNTGFSSCASLDAPRAGPAGAVLGGKVFLIGGGTLPDVSDTVEESAFVEPPSFGPSPLSLVAARRDAVAAVVGGRLHVLGGQGADAPLASTEQLLLDGQSGEPSGDFVAGEALLGPVTGSCLVVVKNRVHMLVPLPAASQAAGHFAAAIVSPALTP